MSESGITYELTNQDKAFLIRKRMNHNIKSMGTVTGLGTKYTYYERGELVSPHADKVIESMFGLVFDDRPPTLKERFQLLNKRHDMMRYVKKWVYWSLAKGEKKRFHNVDLEFIIKKSNGMITHEDFNSGREEETGD